MVQVIPSLLFVAIGSALGGVLRYLVGLMTRGWLSGGFPISTLLINLVGCLLIGILYGLLSRLGLAQGHWGLLLITGLCGGFTTFSTFARESLIMLEMGQFSWLAIYVTTSVIVGIALVALGYHLTR